MAARIRLGGYRAAGRNAKVLSGRALSGRALSGRAPSGRAPSGRYSAIALGGIEPLVARKGVRAAAGEVLRNETLEEPWQPVLMADAYDSAADGDAPSGVTRVRSSAVRLQRASAACLRCLKCRVRVRMLAPARAKPTPMSVAATTIPCCALHAVCRAACYGAHRRALSAQGRTSRARSPCCRAPHARSGARRSQLARPGRTCPSAPPRTCGSDLIAKAKPHTRAYAARCGASGRPRDAQRRNRPRRQTRG